MQKCIVSLLGDTHFQTSCMDARGNPQPLGECADPAAEFSKGIRKETWRANLNKWLEEGNADKECKELIALQDANPMAWQDQVHIMTSHLETGACKMHHFAHRHFHLFLH